MRNRQLTRCLRGLTFAAVLAACSSPASSTAPSGPLDHSPGPSTDASSAPGSLPPGSGALPTAPGPSGSAPVGALDVIPPGSAIAVAVAELNVREQPTTSSNRLVTLKRGDVLVVSPAQMFVGWGPITAGGYIWYPVIQPGLGATAWTLAPLPAYPIDRVDAGVVTGWVATAMGEVSYVTAVAPRCPSTVNLVNVSAMLPAERIACFDEPFVLEGTYGCGGCGGATTGLYEPPWLASPMQSGFLSVDPAREMGPLAVSFEPDKLPELAGASIVRMTVHVNDPLSETCVMAEMDDAEKLVPIHHDTAVYYCRERIVVDSYEVLGTDPDFPFG